MIRSRIALAGDVAAARAEKPKFGTAVRSVFSSAAATNAPVPVAGLAVAIAVPSGSIRRNSGASTYVSTLIATAK
jgi:hypothetical protein